VPDLLQAYLAERDCPCPGCGYNLRGLTSETCPECAQGLTLQVGLTEPRLGRWIAGLVGAACGAGFNGLLLFYVVIMVIRERGRGPGVFLARFIIVNATGLLVMGLVLLSWIRMRRRFRLAEPGAQVAMILGTWLLAAADVTVFAFAIR
jgi:hypothetical protein